MEMAVVSTACLLCIRDVDDFTQLDVYAGDAPLVCTSMSIRYTKQNRVGN